MIIEHELSHMCRFSKSSNEEGEKIIKDGNLFNYLSHTSFNVVFL
jgi:hypothetical protein